MHTSSSDQPTTGRRVLVAPAAETSDLDPDEQVVVTPLARLVVVAVLIVGLAYLVWRTTTLGRGWILALSLPMLLAESWAWVQLLLLRFQVVPSRRQSGSRSPLDGDEIDVVIVVGAGSTPIDLERTLVGLAVTGWRRPTTVLIGEPKPALQAVIDRFASTTALRLESRIHASPAAHPLHSMIDIGDGDWLLWLEAGQVPMPRLFESIARSEVDDTMAVRQFAVGLLNPNSLFHLKRGGDEEALERQLIGPALAGRGLAPWRGAASLVRRAAIRGVIDDAPPHWSVPEWTVALYRNAWTTDYDSRLLIRDLAPASLQPYLVARRDRGAAALAKLGAAFTLRGVPRAARWAAMAGGVSLTYGLRQLAMLSVLATAHLVGRLPFVGDLTTVVAGMTMFSVATMAARRLLSAGTMSFGDWTRHGWRTLGADVAALAPIFSSLSDRRDRIRTPARRHALGQLRLLIVAFSIFEVAFAARAFNIVYPTLLPAMSRRESAILVMVALMATCTLVDVLGVLVLHRQRRRAPRIALDVDVAVAGRRGTTLDVTPIGVGAVLESAPAVGELVPVRFTVPRADGSDHAVETTAWIRGAVRHQSGGVRIGMEFEELNDADRVALIEYCALGVRPVAVAEEQGTPGTTATVEPAAAGTPSMAPSNPDDLSIDVSRGDLNLLRLLTGVATMAAVTALFLGPVAGPVSAESRELGSATIPATLTVTVPTVDGQADDSAEGDPALAATDLRVRLYTDGWSEPLATNGDGRFLRPDTLGVWADEAFVEVALGPDRHVASVPVDGKVTLSRLRIESGDGLDPGTVELAGPGGRWRAAAEGELLVPGRYTVRRPSVAASSAGSRPGRSTAVAADSPSSAGGGFVIERVEVGPGQLVTIGTSGVILTTAGTVTPVLDKGSVPTDTTATTVASTVPTDGDSDSPGSGADEGADGSTSTTKPLPASSEPAEIVPTTADTDPDDTQDGER